MAAIAIPGRQAELAARQETLSELRARAAGQQEPSAVPEVTSEANYGAFRAALAAELAGEPLDMLINNAGVYGHGASVFGRLDEEIWLQALRVNAIAPLKLMESLLGNLLLGKRRIMAAITSKMGSIADNISGGSYAYRSSKAALNAALASAALDLQPKGITVVMFNPGWVKTDMGGPNAELPVESCVQQLRRLIEGLHPQDSGSFIDIDGQDVPW